ncbi:putative transcriptional regulator [archaeon BMS3Abin16]|nr:putative transcriptional regulator [archaeon BMS3Abin16]HDY74108.1 Tfx family DNA-binding protein [Euryarchaeota archaeon]
MVKDSFLTKRQLEILELRNSGLNQTEIAKNLGTTRANISATEKTARENIRKAENTINVAKMLNAAAIIKIEKDTDLNEVPKKIYEKAGALAIHVNLDTPSLIGTINRACADQIKGRRIISEIEIAITKDGDIILR